MCSGGLGTRFADHMAASSRPSRMARSSRVQAWTLALKVASRSAPIARKVSSSCIAASNLPASGEKMFGGALSIWNCLDRALL